nr:helix-turn-helix domain-containing protein [uncultured Draconibacterium sp.]
MFEEIIKVESIPAIHRMLNVQAPQHPLISVVDVSKLKITEDLVGVKVSGDFYYIGLKNAECGSHYGRNDYDFNDGVLAFTAPNQVIAAKSTTDFDQEQGWMLFFHPDLIRGSNLGQNISKYSFFSYDTHEALHLSDAEKQTLNDCVRKIEEELNSGADNYSQDVIISCLELLLNYCMRFYARQFDSRTKQNRDVLIKVESVLEECMKVDQLEKYGFPSVAYLADKVNLSQNYLSDLLRKETGRSAKEHINGVLINHAKSKLLLYKDSTVAEVAYSLGFKYPHYFIRLFKAQTGLTPKQYRQTEEK